MQPINYLMSGQSPFEALMGGMDGFQKYDNNKLVLEQNRIANQSAQDKADYLKQAQQEAQTLDYNDPNAIHKFIAKYESTGLTKGMTNYVSNLDEKERQGLLADTSKAISLLRSGDSANAAQLARERALAYKNAGNPTKAADYEKMAAIIEAHPNAALQSLQMSYAITAGKDDMKGYKDYMDANAPQVKEFSAGGETGAWIRDPYTGEVTYQKLTDNSISPDEQLKADTDITTTGMNNDSRERIVNLEIDGRERVARIGVDGSIQVANINGQFGNQREQISQQGANYRTQAQIAEARKKAEVKEVGGLIIRQYADGSVDVIGKAQPKDGTGANSTVVKQQEESQRIQRVGTVLNEIEKILPNATGSMVGTGVDYVAGAFGHATDGAKSTAQLKSLSGQLIALMPKMSGPQSDKDVAMYREMAGNLADPTLPIATRMAALQTIRDLNNKYAAMNGGGYPQASAPPTGIAKPQQQGGYISGKYK